MKGWLTLFFILIIVASAILLPKNLINKKYPNLTLDEYSRLQIGMTVDEVVAITGKMGYLSNDETTTLFSSQEYEYKERYRKTFKTFYNPPHIKLKFINGRLEEKYWNK